MMTTDSFDYTLLVAGSRTFDAMPVDEFEWFMDHALNLLGTPRQVIQGGAKGIDRLGGQYARRSGWNGTTYHAQWDQLGKRAGYVRNVEMVTVADKAFIIWDGTSKGTRHTINLVLDKGIPSVVLTLEP